MIRRYVTELSDHAWERYVERGGMGTRKKLGHYINAKLNNQIRATGGVPVGKSGTIWLPIGGLLCAGLIIDMMLGRLVVTTFIIMDSEDQFEQLRELEVS